MSIPSSQPPRRPDLLSPLPPKGKRKKGAAITPPIGGTKGAAKGNQPYPNGLGTKGAAKGKDKKGAKGNYSPHQKRRHHKTDMERCFKFRKTSRRCHHPNKKTGSYAGSPRRRGRRNRRRPQTHHPLFQQERTTRQTTHLPRRAQRWIRIPKLNTPWPQRATK